MPGTNAIDLRGSTNGPFHVCRGGSYATGSDDCRWEERGRPSTNTLPAEIGFRVVLATPGVEPVAFTLTIPPGRSFIANQLDQGDNRLSTIFAALTETATFGKWTGNGFSLTTFDPDLGWSDDATLAPGEGASVDYAGTTPVTFHFSGIPRATLVPPVLSGCELLSRQTPEPGDYFSIALRPPVEGTLFYQWVPDLNEYHTNVFSHGAWSPAVPATAIGESAFICVP